MISVQVSCWHWRETYWRPQESIKLCFCVHRPHLARWQFLEEDILYPFNSASQNGKWVFPLGQALKRILMSGEAHHSSCSVNTRVSLPTCVPKYTTYEGMRRLWCVLGGSSNEGGALQSKAALLFWQGHPLQTWGRANALSLPLEWGDFLSALN